MADDVMVPQVVCLGYRWGPPDETIPGLFVSELDGTLACFTTLDTSLYFDANEGVVWLDDGLYAVARWKDEVTFEDGTHWVTATPDGYGDGVLVQVPVTFGGP